MTKSVYMPSNIGIGLFALVYPLGSDYESEGKRGTHHLMEHLMCKSFDHLLPRLKRLGINNSAFTSTDRVVFLFDGLDESLAEVSEELYGIITSGNYTWSKEDFINEKKTVLQEYEDVFNEQVGGTLANAFRKHYRYFDPIGLREDVERFSYDDSLVFRIRFQKPETLCQVGKQNITIQDHSPSLKDYIYFERYTFGNYNFVPQESVPKKKKLFGVFGLGGKTAVGLIGKNLIPKENINRTNFVIACLNDGLESPLLQDIRDKNGLSYFSLGSVFPIFESGAITFISCTSDRYANKLSRVYNDFLSGNLNRHISHERFDDCYQGLMASKKICERLPYMHAMATILEKDPYEGLDNFTYLEALGLLNEYFKIDKFAEIKY
jgi:hypothetical protein